MRPFTHKKTREKKTNGEFGEIGNRKLMDFFVTPKHVGIASSWLIPYLIQGPILYFFSFFLFLVVLLLQFDLNNLFVLFLIRNLSPTILKLLKWFKKPRKTKQTNNGVCITSSRRYRDISMGFQEKSGNEPWETALSFWSSFNRSNPFTAVITRTES